MPSVQFGASKRLCEGLFKEVKDGTTDVSQRLAMRITQLEEFDCEVMISS